MLLQPYSRIFAAAHRRLYMAVKQSHEGTRCLKMHRWPWPLAQNESLQQDAPAQGERKCARFRNDEEQLTSPLDFLVHHIGIATSPLASCLAENEIRRRPNLGTRLTLRSKTRSPVLHQCYAHHPNASASRLRTSQKDLTATRVARSDAAGCFCQWDGGLTQGGRHASVAIYSTNNNYTFA
jgi:hypothetical protein